MSKVKVSVTTTEDYESLSERDKSIYDSGRKQAELELFWFSCGCAIVALIAGCFLIKNLMK